MKEFLRQILIVWSYCRTSGKVNGEASIPNQKMMLREFAEKEGLHIRGELVDEAKSASREHIREGFEELLHLINNNKVDVVLVTFFNRLARRAEDMLNILLLMKSKNIECISVIQGKRLSRMSNYEIAFEAIMAEEENKSITRRIHSTKYSNRSKGEYLTKPAIGYERDENRHLIVVKDEVEIIKGIFTDYLNGKTPKEIAKSLNESKIAGRNWSTDNVEYLLTNPIYTGKMYKRIEDEGFTRSYELLSSVGFEAIIEEETFFKVANEINDKKRNKEKRAYIKHHHLFKGILYCPVCNKKMRASTLYYSCANENCPFSSIRKDKIEKHLLEFVESLDKRPDSFNSVKQKIHKYTFQINKLQTEMEELKFRFATNRVNKQTLEKGMFRIGQVIKDLQDKIDFEVYKGEDISYYELINQQKYKELTDLMIQRKLTLTFLEEGNDYKIKKL